MTISINNSGFPFQNTTRPFVFYMDYSIAVGTTLLLSSSESSSFSLELQLLSLDCTCSFLYLGKSNQASLFFLPPFFRLVAAVVVAAVVATLVVAVAPAVVAAKEAVVAVVAAVATVATVATVAAVAAVAVVTAAVVAAAAVFPLSLVDLLVALGGDLDLDLEVEDEDEKDGDEDLGPRSARDGGGPCLRALVNIQPGVIPPDMTVEIILFSPLFLTNIGQFSKKKCTVRLLSYVVCN